MLMRVVTFKASRRLILALEDAALYYHIGRSEAIRRAIREFVEEPPARLEAPPTVLQPPVVLVSVKVPVALLDTLDRLRLYRYRAYRSELIREAIWRWLQRHKPRIEPKVIVLREPPVPTHYLAID